MFTVILGRLRTAMRRLAEKDATIARQTRALAEMEEERERVTRYARRYEDELAAKDETLEELRLHTSEELSTL